MNNTLHIITGTTAAGKTDYALSYAETIDAEIISCDASLVYNGMDIGTAKPTAEELERVHHHCIDLHSVDQPFNITLYEAAARKAVEAILAKGKSVVVTGGSGFYLKSFFEPVVDTVIIPSVVREQVEAIYTQLGLRGLVSELKQLSPEGLGHLDILNPRRVQRALERCMASGQSLPELQKAFAQRAKPYASMDKHLILLERDEITLKERVSKRADSMLNEGLIDEVKDLLDLGIEKNPNAAGAIGYRETIAFLKGEIKADELHALIVKNTNALVKKQRTWIRSQLRDPDERILL
mgnify:FL=1